MNELKNQNHFLYVLQNKNFYTTFSADIQQFPLHKILIETLNPNIFTDLKNNFLKHFPNKFSKILDKSAFNFANTPKNEVLNTILKIYKND